jgi:hypothetical protein
MGRGKSGNERTVGEGIVRGTDTSVQGDVISTEKVQLSYPIFTSRLGIYPHFVYLPDLQVDR